MIRATGLKLGNNITEAPLTEMSDRLIVAGRAEAALRYVELAAEFCPMSWRVQADLAEAYHFAGQPDAAQRALRRVRELDPRQYDDMLDYLGLEPPLGN
jgi:Flp pilus assembly protein TadD